MKGSTAFSARILGRFEKIISYEASHDSGSEEEEYGSEAHEEIEKKEDSNPRVREVGLKEGGDKETGLDYLKEI